MSNMRYCGYIYLYFNTRCRNYIFIFTMFGCFLLLYMNSYTESLFRKWSQYPQGNDFKHRNYLISTEGCTISAMEPLSEHIRKFVSYPSTYRPCTQSNYSLLEHNRTRIWVTKNSETLNFYNVTNINQVICCYSSFIRPKFSEKIYPYNADRTTKYAKCKMFSRFIVVNQTDEFVRVKCALWAKYKSYNLFSKKKLIYDKFFLFATNKSELLQTDVTSNKTNTTYNVLVVGIDNVSRLNFLRTMPKTAAFFEEKDGVELLGYNKVGDNSLPNLIPLLMGYSHKEIEAICHPKKYTPYDQCPFLWHQYEAAGFFTAFAEDSAYLGTFNYLQPGFIKQPTHYYMRPFTFESEQIAYNKIYSAKLCLNELPYYKILLNYIENIIAKVNNTAGLFGFFWEATITHDNLNYPMLIDESYEQFFKRLEYSRYLDNTVIVLLSDHGMRWGPIRYTKQGYLEERLPLANILLPKSFQDNYATAFFNLRHNARALTTPYDLHETLVDLLDLKNIEDGSIYERSQLINTSSRGISLFLPVPGNRTCDAIGVDEHWCSCYETIPIYKNVEYVIPASKFLVTHINSLLVSHSQCMELTLKEVVKSEEIVTNLTIGVNLKTFAVTVITSPSNAIFEGTLRVIGNVWSVVGTVSRLNLYDKQSYCVDDPELKLFCFCD